MQSRKPVANAKLIVDDLSTKQRIISLSAITGESMKSIIMRLVEKEYSKVMKGEEII
jgi:hypothetical protein